MGKKGLKHVSSLSDTMHWAVIWIVFGASAVVVVSRTIGGESELTLFSISTEKLKKINK